MLSDRVVERLRAFAPLNEARGVAIPVVRHAGQFVLEIARVPVVQMKTPAPGVRRVAHDAQEPGARAAVVTEIVEEPQRAHESLLHHVLRVLVVAHDPPREVVRGIKVRQHAPLEARNLCGGVVHPLVTESSHCTVQTAAAAALFPDRRHLCRAE
jgi:hypothetical protein